MSYPQNERDPEGPYQCSVCNKCFSSYIALCIHMKTHSGEKQLKCDICDKDFTNERNLLKHVCSRYNETFLSGNDFKKHTRFCNSEERQSIKGGNTVMSVSSKQNDFRIAVNNFFISLNYPVECGRKVDTNGNCF